MNRPIKGDSYRRGQYAHVMFQASASDVPSMRIKINEGSFWANNKELVEYGGGQSPVIEAPKSGAKWVLVAINKLGKAVLYNGQAVPNNPDAPKVDKNVLPVAFVYIKSSTTVITNDMIYDARPLYAAGGYPEQHNLLAGRDESDCHPISAITGLKEALDDRLTLNDAQEEFNRKADVDGTTGANFVLNMEDNGTPVEYCGIRVNRGSQPQVGIRFNEDEDQWQYTNDGSVWHPLGNDVDLSDMATYYTAGITQLSVDPEDPKHPIAVGDNDPRLKEIEKKVSKEELQRGYVSKSDMNLALRDKANAEDVYSKEDAEDIFLTRAEFRTSGGYTKDQLNDFFNAKANITSIYTRKEIEEKLTAIYTKEEIDALFTEFAEKNNCHCCGHSGEGEESTDKLSNYYTSQQVNELIQQLNNKVYESDVLDVKFENIQTVIAELKTLVNDKANASDVYTKAEIDDKLSKISEGEGAGSSTSVDMSNYYTKADVNLLNSDKADINHGHTANQISQDSTHRMVTDDQITAWNNKADALKYEAENVANKGVANGYASLDANGKVPLSQLPSFSAGVGKGGIVTVADYNALLTIAEPDADKLYLVADASDDVTVESGWAEYVYADDTWLKIGERESLDIELDFTKLKNVPQYFDVDPEVLEKYGTTGTAGNVYTKTEVDNLLKNKADSKHNHDGEYVTSTALDTKLADYVKSDNDKLHSSKQLGSYTVDETGMADGAVLTYNAEKEILQYKAVEAGSSSDNSDKFDVGNYRVNEPAELEDGMALVYEKTGETTGRLTYKKISAEASDTNKVGSVEVDEHDMADGKVLVYNATDKKLVYQDMPTVPKNLLDIDNTDKKEGRVLALQENGKLGYVDLPKASEGSSSETPVAGGQQLFDLKSDDGVVQGKFRADSKDAVKIDYSGDTYTITFDRTKNITMIQFVTQNMIEKVLHINTVFKDGKKWIWTEGNYADLPLPFISYIQINGNQQQKCTSGSYGVDDTDKFKITNLNVGYPVFVKMLY